MSAGNCLGPPQHNRPWSNSSFPATYKNNSSIYVPDLCTKSSSCWGSLTNNGISFATKALKMQAKLKDLLQSLKKIQKHVTVTKATKQVKGLLTAEGLWSLPVRSSFERRGEGESWGERGKCGRRVESGYNGFHISQSISDRQNVRFNRMVWPNFYSLVRPKWQIFFLENIELFPILYFSFSKMASLITFLIPQRPHP